MPAKRTAKRTTGRKSSPARSTPKSKTSAKKSRSSTTKATGVGVENQSTYNKLIKRGMTPKQAAAFSRHAGGPSKSGAKSSKSTTKRLTRGGKKK